MKIKFLIICFAAALVFCSDLFSQKPLVDISRWPSLGSPMISDNGQYVVYSITNGTDRTQTTIIKSTENSWKRELTGPIISDVSIANKAELVILLNDSDDLVILPMSERKETRIEHVSSYKFCGNVKDEWLAYQLQDPENVLVLRNLITGITQKIPFVVDYYFDDKAGVLLLQTKSENLNDTRNLLEWIDLSSGVKKTIWRGLKADKISFDESGSQLVFNATLAEGNRVSSSIWYYQLHLSEAIVLVDKKTKGMGEKIVDTTSEVHFSKGDSMVLFKILLDNQSKIEQYFVPLDLWSFCDKKLQPEQLETDARLLYDAMINVNAGKVVSVGLSQNETVDDVNDEYLLVTVDQGGSKSESNWNLASRISVYLVSKKGGSRILLGTNLDRKSASYYESSPAGKYIVYFDKHAQNYFCYEIKSQKLRIITKRNHVQWGEKDFDYPGDRPPEGLAAWMDNDKSVLIYDCNNDIWQIDPGGREKPVNITNGYALKHRIKFYFIQWRKILTDKTTGERKSGSIVMSAFNLRTKFNGFFRARLSKKSDPEQLTMGPFLYFWPSVPSDKPIKASDAQSYLVTRMSAKDAPNFYFTKDFKNFRALTDVNPQRVYNWLSTELFSWKTFDGSKSEGILYKPEDFDPQKKYPIIFHFYERLSDNLFEFIYPGSSNGPINIPWFVNRGYLVFCPDIHYIVGKPGESAFNSVVSAAKYLAKMPWVDSSRMGIQGHSFGGYEVNYIVTHTRLFKAAVSASGVCDFVSLYDNLFSSASSQFLFETSQTRIGKTLWQSPGLYINNSPIFESNKVVTPLLLMSNKRDRQVPFDQGLEFFNALRRLNRKIWMLQYDDGAHEVWGKSARDYSIRMTQFFDHYLKGAPTPRWMVEGIDASKKGIDNGLDLEPQGIEPGFGLMKNNSNQVETYKIKEN